jgi:hypothetical protein
MARWRGPDGFATPAERIEVDAKAGGVHRKAMVLESPQRPSAG